MWRMGGNRGEEETSLRNHLKWARVKTKGDGGKVPKEVEIEDIGLTFICSYLLQTPTILLTGEDEQKRMENRWVNESYGEVHRPDSYTTKKGGTRGL